MADELTPNLGLTKPDVGASDDTWGEKLNINFDILDQLKAAFISDMPPDIPSPGMLWWEASTGALFIYYDDASSQQWVEIGRASSGGGGGSGGATVTSSDTPPTSPVKNDIWWNSSTGAAFIYYDDGNSSQWVQMGTAPVSSGGSNVFIGDTMPGFASPGDLWWHSGTGAMYIYYDDGSSSQWVETGAGIP